NWKSPTLTSASQFHTASDSAPNSPMMTGTPVFQSAPSSPMLQSSEWSSTTSATAPTPTSTSSGSGAFATGGSSGPAGAEDAAPPPAQAHSSNSTLLVAGTSALGSLLLISALLWALIVRAKRGQRRKHLADVLEKVGTSPSSSATNFSRKDSFGNAGTFPTVEWDDLAEKAIGLPSATSNVTLQKDASFCWKYPTLSVPPAAVRAMTETHYVKRRSTMPARSRSEVSDYPPRIPSHTVEFSDDVDLDADIESLVTEDDDDDDGPPAWLAALAGVDGTLPSALPSTASAASTSAASDSEARKGWLNFAIPPNRRTSTPYNSHLSLAPTLQSLSSVYSSPASPQLPPMIVPSITITVDDGDFGMVDRPLSMIEERGYDSESAEGCLDADDFPTIPRWESQLRRI
ncbi:hypothetical protein OC846_006466, partial [Tilletia horrida]